LHLLRHLWAAFGRASLKPSTHLLLFSIVPNKFRFMIINPYAHSDLAN